MIAERESSFVSERPEESPRIFIPQERVRQITQEIGDFYHLPPENIRRAAETPVEILTEENFHCQVKNFFESETVRLVPLIEQEIRQKFKSLGEKEIQDAVKIALSMGSFMAEERAQEKAKEMGGFWLNWDGRSRICIVEDFLDEWTIRHELIHALAQFEDGSSGFQNKDALKEYHCLNDTVTELLSIYQKEGVSLKELAGRLLTKELGVSCFRGEVLVLTTCLLATEKSGRPMSIQTVVNHYFGKEERPGDKVLWFWRDIQQRFPEEDKIWLTSFLDLLCFGIEPSEDLLKELINNV